MSTKPRREENADPTPDPCREALARHLRPEMFQALADPTRVALVCRLATAPEPVTVTEASTCCGVHLSGVSRHLAQLRDAGLVEAHRDGRHVLYRLDCRGLAHTLRDVASALDDCRAACCAAPTEGSR